MTIGSGRFGSAPVEMLIYQLATDPVKGVAGTPVGDRIHRMPVPAHYVYPFLTYSKRNAQDTGPIGQGLPISSSVLTYEIKGVDEGYDTSGIAEAADIMDSQLDGSSHTVVVDEVWYDVTVHRTSELQDELPPDSDGTVFVHLGGIYDFMVARIS